MRPNELYNWYCVFRSITVIFRHATEIRMHQATVCSHTSTPSKRSPIDEDGDVAMSGQVAYEDATIEISEGEKAASPCVAQQINLKSPVNQGNASHMESKNSGHPGLLASNSIQKPSLRVINASASVQVNIPVKSASEKAHLTPRRLAEESHTTETEAPHTLISERNSPPKQQSNIIISDVRTYTI